MHGCAEYFYLKSIKTAYACNKTLPSPCNLSALGDVIESKKYAVWVIAQENSWDVKRLYSNNKKSIVSVELPINRAIPFAVTSTIT